LRTELIEPRARGRRPAALSDPSSSGLVVGQVPAPFATASMMGAVGERAGTPRLATRWLTTQVYSTKRVKNVQISLVGQESEGARAALRVTPPVDHIVLLHSPAPESVRAAQEVARVMARLPGTTCELKAIDPDGMNDILTKMVEVRKAVGDASNAQVTIVVSGGTSVMAGAAFVGCLLIEGEAVYINEDLGVGRDQVPQLLPDRIMRFLVLKTPPEKLSEPLRAVLRAMPIGQDEVVAKAPTYLHNKLGLPLTTASFRLKKLAELNLVNYRRQGRGGLASLTDSGRLCAALLT
jgi:DNA-binding transcriptional ArsR family regulator